ncbi:MAG: DUF3299 domain-containing protein [Arenicellales bacterium]|nr:DUF3299 domain-containing protein [Arenicellales bacterium]
MQVKINSVKILGLMLCLVYVAGASAADVREIGWQDLIPPRNFDDPFEALTEDQLYDLGTIVRTREFYKSSPSSVSEEMLERAETLEKELDQQGIDVDGLLARRDEIAEKRRAQAYSVVEDLNGKSIRMPGYVLPVEFDGQKVTEFFLVPYVGACIHVPPPPPNQMVYVNSNVGIETKGLFDPVWVEGTILTTGKTNPWTAFDGVLDITAGYTMQADGVEPYEYE